MTYRKTMEGFSLVEISVVLVVVATMLAGVLPAITESQKSKATDVTAERMKEIELALKTFRSANSRVPCPADITLSVTTANFGKEADALGECRDGAGAIDANWETATVVGGGVPVKSLGLADEYAFDGWGHRFSYHITKTLTLDTTYIAATGGSITVRDGAAAPSDRTTVAAYALISHGPSGHGAYTRGASRYNFGTTNARELENCDCDSSAVATAYNSVFHQYMAIPNTDPRAGFDDIVHYAIRASLDQLSGGGGDSLWDQVGSADIRNTNSGNVGIGVAPTSPLHVSATTSLVQQIESSNTSHNELRMANSSVGSMAAGSTWAILQTGSTPAGGVTGVPSGSFHLWQHGVGSRLAVLNNGNIGIGTAAPAETLDIQTPTGTRTGIKLLQNGVYQWWMGMAAGGAYWHLIPNGSGGTAAMTVTHTGSVGIGTAAPGQKLDVTNSSSSSIVKIDSAANANAGVFMYEAGSIRFYAYSQNNNDTYYITDADQSHGVYLTQNSSAWQATSDRRLKENIKPYSVLDKLDNYRAVSFDWKNGGEHDVGVIAQELYEAFPEVVAKGDDDPDRKISKITEPGVWSAKYEQLGALAMQGVKELNDKMKELEAKAPSLPVDAPQKRDGLPRWLIGLLAVQSIAIVWLVLDRRRAA